MKKKEKVQINKVRNEELNKLQIKIAKEIKKNILISREQQRHWLSIFFRIKNCS